MVEKIIDDWEFKEYLESLGILGNKTLVIDELDNYTRVLIKEFGRNYIRIIESDN